MFNMFKRVGKAIVNVGKSYVKKRAVAKIFKLASKSSVPTTVLLEVYNTVRSMEDEQKKKARK